MNFKLKSEPMLGSSPMAFDAIKHKHPLDQFTAEPIPEFLTIGSLLSCMKTSNELNMDQSPLLYTINTSTAQGSGLRVSNPQTLS